MLHLRVGLYPGNVVYEHVDYTKTVSYSGFPGSVLMYDDITGTYKVVRCGFLVYINAVPVRKGVYDT